MPKSSDPWAFKEQFIGIVLIPNIRFVDIEPDRFPYAREAKRRAFNAFGHRRFK